jgi:hypothetical protein
VLYGNSILTLGGFVVVYLFVVGLVMSRMEPWASHMLSGCSTTEHP